MRRILILALALILAVSAAACNKQQLSEKAEGGLKAFVTTIKTFPDKIGFHKELEHWGFELPTGEKFEWSRDMSANKVDLAMVMLADPFISAGLDVEKLNADEWVFMPAGNEDGMDTPNLLVKPHNVKDEGRSSNGYEDAMRKLLLADENLLTYHGEMKHYRLKFSEGFEVRWTEELSLNDEDFIFILKAEPLINAGLDITKLEGSGWEFRAAGQDASEMGDNPDQLVKKYKL
ncbi:hypothetical protein OXPF_07290 [Oxobacter pfennigii]|uniref:Lipoprotein n=1 Tax=Oxobacter pfennigii TaxID=36849 RepID=A0A0N8NTQ6_9CLOT|nr:hypothetical protein [Oxobacter pfennigii]KPU45496.1 hypothetical protein OXPF_07290 [Oxobacter pfennigii]